MVPGGNATFLAEEFPVRFLWELDSTFQ